MSLWRQITDGFHSLIDSRSADQEVADEIRDYLSQMTQAWVDAGLSYEDARRRACSEFGDATLVRQQVRSTGWEKILVRPLTDLRFAIRQLRHTPSFTIMSVLILALSIGGCTAIFSALDAVLFKPLPYLSGDRLVMIWEDYSKLHPIGVAFGTFQGLERQSHSFESMAALKPWHPVLVNDTHEERLEGQEVSSAYFHVLAASPLLGRAFVPSDDQPHASNVAIVSEQLWRTQLAASHEAIGRQVMLDGSSYSVIGVMPKSFKNVLAPSASIWTPLRYDPALPLDGKEWGHHLHVVARLQDGVSESQAGRESNQVFNDFKQRFAAGYNGSGGVSSGVSVDPLQKDISLHARPALTAIFAAELLLVLLACVSVTSILLMHGIQRRNGLSIRTVPHANPYRAMRQVLLESSILAVAGGILGIPIAWAGSWAMALSAPLEPSLAHAIHFGRAEFMFLVGVIGILGVLLGVVPGLAVYRGHKECKSRLRMPAPIKAARWNPGPLVTTQIALTFALLVGAGMLLHSIQLLLLVNPGFDASHLLTMQIQESGSMQNVADDGVESFAHTLAAIRQVPGVVSAGMTSQLPLSGEHEVYGIKFEKDANPVGDAALRYAVMPGYLEAMGITLRRGRLFNERDLLANTQRVVIINESFAKHEFAGLNPLGQRVRVGLDVAHADRPWATVIGVVGDVKQTSLSEVEENEFYIPASQWPWTDKAPWIAIRTTRDAASSAPSIEAALRTIDPGVIIGRSSSMDFLVATSRKEQRFVLVLFGAFGIIAVALLALGIYDAFSTYVPQRSCGVDLKSVSDFNQSTIRMSAIRYGLGVVLPGILVGVCISLSTTPLLATLLFGISKPDLVTYLGSMGAILMVFIAVSQISVWRASKIVLSPYRAILIDRRS